MQELRAKRLCLQFFVFRSLVVGPGELAVKLIGFTLPTEQILRVAIHQLIQTVVLAGIDALVFCHNIVSFVIFLDLANSVYLSKRSFLRRTRNTRLHLVT